MAESFIDALDLVAVPAFVIDVLPSGAAVFKRINKAHEAMTGLREADIAGRTPSQVFPARLAKTLTENYARAVRAKEATTYQELLAFPKGEEWWQTTLMPVLGADGNVNRIIGTAVNITEQKRAEIEQAERMARAHAINEEIEETLTLAAHDLKGPLVNIQAMVREMKKGFVDLNDGKLAILDHIEIIGTKATAFVEEMLQYRETAGLTPAVSRFNLGQSIGDIVAVLDPMSKHFIHFNSVEIESDALAMQIVLRNLIDNAIRHADRRDLMIAIDVSEDQPGVLTVTVGDNGNGLLRPEAVSAPEAEAARKLGSGYGLRGVRRLIRSRGGDMWVGTPLFSSGATVHFSLAGRLLGEETAPASDRQAA